MTTPSAPADPALVERIAERGESLRRRIAERTDRDVTVVCVTKAHPPAVAAAALAAGFRDLGENYAQELRDKAAPVAEVAEALGSAPVRWHFIGRLQTNKVRLIAPAVSLWESVDRASLASQIAGRAPGAAVLVQLDLAGLPDRGGCPPDEAPELVARCRELGLDVRGLMGVGPPGDPELARPGFRRLVAMADDLGLPERSIGMSADLDVAVDEGATIVRVGSALVGPRPPRT
ncbi:YggS family pyridoxal phosphate enzyme [Dermatobacter hominis]|uniref:YggS family pyridoxal phosphate enzyme n=1 Tax=Dermatobacter hominis TaxID=2884263 RepID=UPI001D1293E4|nr:YggS family pyridoxal phosphate enzyme [Dermatobacter hominis]UDY35982.1 YggS family pyridoxal phosphate enzyme [Dermatobacter hominis]